MLVAYHESLWLAIAAAAPIVALANTVSITDAVGIWFSSTARKRPVRSRFGYIVVITGSGLNLIIQASVLYVALRSLAAEKDTYPLGSVVWPVVLGLAYVLVIVAANITLRYDLRVREEEKKDDEVAAKEVTSQQAAKTIEMASGLGWPDSPRRSDRC